MSIVTIQFVLQLQCLPGIRGSGGGGEIGSDISVKLLEETHLLEKVIIVDGKQLQHPHGKSSVFQNKGNVSFKGDCFSLY